MAEPRKHTEVAVGILLREDGAMLLSTRPPGKPYAGYWEFPGASWKRVRP
jgi:8-oxo-dGTP diphosphatase